jgi:hypothetical protein
MRSRDGRRRGSSQEQQQQEQEHQVPSSTTSTQRHWPPPPTDSAEALPRVVVVELCAVCLDEVREERHERVTRLPCSHQYHSDCVLPWLAIQPDCPCCRTLVPQLHTLS